MMTSAFDVMTIPPAAIHRCILKNKPQSAFCTIKSVCRIFNNENKQTNNPQSKNNNNKKAIRSEEWHLRDKYALWHIFRVLSVFYAFLSWQSCSCGFRSNGSQTVHPGASAIWRLVVVSLSLSPTLNIGFWTLLYSCHTSQVCCPWPLCRHRIH